MIFFLKYAVRMEEERQPVYGEGVTAATIPNGTDGGGF